MFYEKYDNNNTADENRRAEQNKKDQKGSEKVRESRKNPGVDSLGGRMNVEDDLRSGWRPLQVASNPDPQLIDVSVFAIIR